MTLNQQVLLLPLTCIAITSIAHAQTIDWCGQKWHVRTAQAQGPGPNDWSSKNVWIDSHGFLHMKIAEQDGKWTCAEIWTDHDLGFGTYQCQVEGPIDHFDPNIVFSMFSYAGPDGTRETDIEIAKWGNSKEMNGWWTVYPNDSSGKKTSKGFNFKLDRNLSTHRFRWEADSVHYWMFGGLQPLRSNDKLIHDWFDHPANSKHDITQMPIPLHFNLWLFEGKPPADGKPVEVIIHRFDKVD